MRTRVVFHALVILALIGEIGGLAQVRADDVPRVSFPPMTQDDVDRFRDSLKNNVPLVSYPPKVSQHVDPHTEGVWSGTSTEVTTSIGEVVLRFRPSTEELLTRSITNENSSKALLESVDLKIAYNAHDQYVGFVHSHPQIAAEVGGFKAKIKRDGHPTRVKMILGQREAGMYVAVPPFSDPGTLWGLYVCPRTIRYQAVGRTGTRIMRLEGSPYNLSEVKIMADAVGSATFEASRGKVRAVVTLQLSEGLPESLTPTDLSIATVAEPKVSYRPKFPFDFTRFAPRNDLQEGLNMMVELQNRSGKIRRQNFSHVVSVHKSNEPSPVPVQLNGIRPTSDAGDCYIVQAQKYSWKEYDKGEVNF
ncbi:MAG: hypothetical protein RIS36_1821 [Pseudomonadota bacterium]